MRMLEEDVLTETEAARQLRVSISGMRKWRREGSGPRFIRIGRLVRYAGDDIREWLRARSHTQAEAAVTDPQSKGDVE